MNIIDPPSPDSSEHDDKVIQLYPDAPPLSIDRTRLPYCSSQCVQVVLNPDRRLLTCRECGRVQEAFDYLYARACRKETRLGSLKELDVQIKRRSEELHRLKMDVENAKAQLKRAIQPLFVASPTPES